MKKYIFPVLLVGLVLFLLSCTASPVKVRDSVAIETYKDIPGVTDDEISAIELLKMHRTSFSYGHLAGTEGFLLSDGTYGGFTYMLCELLTELFGIAFIPECFESWDNFKTSLDQRAIDFMGELTQTPERMELYYMTHAIAERSLRVFTHMDSDRIETESDINGLKIGFFAGTITADYIKKNYPVLFETVFTYSNDDAAQKLKTGEIDAFVADAILDSAFDSYGFIRSEELFSLVYTPVSMATSNPDLEPIISVINKYLAAGGIDKLHELYKLGDYEYFKCKLEKSFTDEEKAYLENLSEQGVGVSLALEHDNYPVSFYNDKDKEFQGIAVDIIREISNLIDIKFNIVTTRYTTWAEILERLRVGEISMVSQLLYSDNRKGNFIWSSVPYASSHYALISKSEYPNLAIYQVIRSRVGTISKSAYEDMFNEWFSNSSNMIAYETLELGLTALEKNEIDLLMVSEYILLTQINYREKSGYKINIRFNTPMDSLFGFNKNEEILRSIIDKAQAYINTDNIADDWERRVFDYSTKLARLRVMYLSVFVIILSSVLIITLYLLLQNRKISKALKIDMMRRKEAEEKAYIASKAKGNFLAYISHEIRTPLNAIMGMSAIAKQSIDNPEKTIFSINQIISSSNHLLGILNNVLDISKIESGMLQLANEPFSLRESFDEIAVIIKQRCQEKSISLITNVYDISNTTIIGDKLRMNQVLINLMGNAVKFTDNGGTIKFVIDILDESDKNITLLYSVSDNGRGMTDEQISKLFTPFEQTDRSIVAKYGGSGLGLSICQNLVEMMGGIIEVESSPFNGSRFYFELTFEKGVRQTHDMDVTPDSLELTGKRILLVEDIDINRMIIVDILSSTGVEIDEAENGKQAVDFFANSASGYYDLVFMDIQMPILNGYDATKAIRKLERTDAKSVPIIAMTANAYKEDYDNAINAGMNDHLPKPIDISVLLRILARFISN